MRLSHKFNTNISYAQVKDATMTSSYLDKALFSDIVKYHNNSMGRKKTTVEWIIQGSHERENSATAVLDSLVRRGILGRESMLCGRKYPTLNSGRQSFVCNEFAVFFFVMHIEFYLPPTSSGILGDKKSFFWPEGRKCLKKISWSSCVQSIHLSWKLFARHCINNSALKASKCQFYKNTFKTSAA